MTGVPRKRASFCRRAMDWSLPASRNLAGTKRDPDSFWLAHRCRKFWCKKGSPPRMARKSLYWPNAPTTSLSQVRTRKEIFLLTLAVVSDGVLSDAVCIYPGICSTCGKDLETKEWKERHEKEDEGAQNFSMFGSVAHPVCSAVCLGARDVIPGIDLVYGAPRAYAARI
eukprot:134301-Rhodomonas_salina.1